MAHAQTLAYVAVMADPRTSSNAGSDFILASQSQRHVLVDANTPSRPNIVAGGTYLVNQIAQTYGTVELQVLAPDNATWVTIYSWTAADTDGGLEIKLGALAAVRIKLTNTTGAYVVLAQVPA